MIQETKSVEAKSIMEQVDQGEDIHIYDVRTGLEYRAAHPSIAQHLPLSRLNKKVLQEICSGHEQVYFLCASGQRSVMACDRARKAGFSNVSAIEGGLGAWQQAGLPITRGAPGLSLERQVRIAAGFLVLLGIGLGFGVHPGWLGLSAFVGAGLVLAGITDRCGMALLLGHLPWNR
jgi:rhodanese-related sulfurtransferase